MNKPIGIRIILLIVICTLLIGAVIYIKNTSAPIADQQSDSLFQQYVISGGPIVWFILLPMSLLTAFLAVENFIIIRKGYLLGSDYRNAIITAIEESGTKPAEKLAQSDDLISKAIYKAVTQSRGDLFRMKHLISESFQEQAAGLLRRIEWLNMIGNVSPMVGLFGTVFGMIKLFDSIVKAGGQPQPAQFASGISTALVTTLWGLFIAIPALALYGIFKNKIEEVISYAVDEGEDIMLQIRQILKNKIMIQNQKNKSV